MVLQEGSQRKEEEARKVERMQELKGRVMVEVTDEEGFQIAEETPTEEKRVVERMREVWKEREMMPLVGTLLKERGLSN